MDSHPLPSTMKSPRDQRSGIWLRGVLQIHLTRACTLSCIGCTQGSNLTGKTSFMSLEHFEEACISVKGYFGVVGLFGGQPTLHPQFPEICEIMRRHVPFNHRGLWTQDLNGHGKVCRETFNPSHSNLNVHTNVEAALEMINDWPECAPYVKGLEDSRHSPPFVAMQDMEDMTDEERWDLIGDCDVNQRWSSLIGVFRGELRAWFCELAAAQAMLHQHEPDYPDTGKKVVPGWWDNPMSEFDAQVRFHCFACGHPLRGPGDLAMEGTVEQVSKTHANVYKLKKPHGKTVQLVTRRDQLGGKVSAATQYLPGERA
jgi:hypothetical protein